MWCLLPLQQFLHLPEDLIRVLDVLDDDTAAETDAADLALHSGMACGDQLDRACAEHPVPHCLFQDTVSDLIVVHRALHDGQESLVEFSLGFIEDVAPRAQIHQREEEDCRGSHKTGDETDKNRFRAEAYGDAEDDAGEQ